MGCHRRKRETRFAHDLQPPMQRRVSVAPLGEGRRLSHGVRNAIVSAILVPARAWPRPRSTIPNPHQARSFWWWDGGIDGNAWSRACPV